MSHPLVNLSPDLVRLRNEGYEVEIRGSHLLVGHIPYVDSGKNVRYGTLVSELSLQGNKVVRPRSHVVHFIGLHPCHRDGSIMKQIKHASQRKQLTDGLIVDHSFSNKPAGGYTDFFHKMDRYAEVISAPAQAIDPSHKAKTFKVIASQSEESVFHYVDTNSTRSYIEAISNRLKGFKIGIIGLGGTGSYILDLVAKTPVEEIHLFDGDEFAQHNAFRAPGAPSLEQLLEPPHKVSYFSEIYSRMRRGIIPHVEFLTEGNLEQLRGLDFVFISMDKGAVKAAVVPYLEEMGISFIDVGMGVQIGENCLLGLLRVVTSTPGKRDHFRKEVPFDDGEDDEYSTNIQIADLNMLNAALAVIKWKKLCGFYQDLEKEHSCGYSINLNQLYSDEPGS